MFSAIKLMQRELGPTHISADIGCHSFATFAPFSLRQFHPRLRHVAGERGGGDPQHGTAPDRDHGRRRVLAQRPHHRCRLEPVQQGRRRADRDAERLRLRHRPAVSAVERRQPQRHADRHDHRADLRSLGVKWLRTVRSYSVARMARRSSRPCAAPSAAQGDHRRRRMPARAPARVRAEDAERSRAESAQ